jgi:hypothetical protein
LPGDRHVTARGFFRTLLDVAGEPFVDVADAFKGDGHMPVGVTQIGLAVGRDTVGGESTDTAVGLDGNHANIAMLQMPDGNGRLELFEYIPPEASSTPGWRHGSPKR